MNSFLASWFPGGFPGLTAVVSRILGRDVLPYERASDVIIEALGVIADRLDALELKLEEMHERELEDLE